MSDFHRFEVDEGTGSVSAILSRPEAARWLLVLAHGAGAGMLHPVMQGLAERLAEEGMATFRYQFPYLEQGRRRPSPRPILLATVRAAVAEAHRLAPDLPLFAGGKSMGGRMSSHAAAEMPLPGVRGLVFFGFPLHPAGRPGTERAEHLRDVELPLLFLQGTRDKLAETELIRPVCRRLGPRTTLHWLEGADHSFQVLKRSGRTHEEVMAEIARSAASWAGGFAGSE